MRGNAMEATPQQLKALPPPLLAWYDENRRVLPWREQVSPYRTWVSEIMLQQTRVTAVLPYFDRFMAALPTVAALADAPEQQLMSLWQGLGYYSRARNLQKAAQVIMTRVLLMAKWVALMFRPAKKRFSTFLEYKARYGSG